MERERPLPFDSIQYVGLSSRFGNEPFSLEHASVLAQAARKSRKIVKKYKGDEEPLKGHRVEIFDLGALANLAVATHFGESEGPSRNGGENQLRPEDLLKILEPEKHEYLARRLQSMRPVVTRITNTHLAVAKALGLEKITPFSVGSMVEDPEHLFHNPAFRTLMGAIWGFRSSRVHGDTSIKEQLFDLIPQRYRRRFEQNKGRADGYLSYGIVELAALITPLLIDKDVRVFQYAHSREQTYLMLAQAILIEMLGIPPEQASNLIVLQNACGRTLDGKPTEADTYRMTEEEVKRGLRLSVNPSPDLEQLKRMLINGGGKFNSNANVLIRDHVVNLLRRLSAEGRIDEGRGERERLDAATTELSHEENVAFQATPEQAAFLVEALYNHVIVPIRAELERAGLIYTLTASDTDAEVGGNGGNGGHATANEGAGVGDRND